MFRKFGIIFANRLKFHDLNKQIYAHRHYWNAMDCIDLNPPKSVRGMTKLDRDAFRKVVKIPKLKVLEENSNKVLPILKKHILKMDRLKPVVTVPRGEDGKVQSLREIRLHPLAVSGFDSLPEEIKKFGVSESDFFFDDVELTYDNWRADEILKFVLPEDQETLTSFSRVGYIVHINLRDHLYPFKALIGEVLKDKVVGCRTVVNKAKTIDNTYRNFQQELICGDAEYEVEVKENGVKFQFDFSKVYWNPRLSTEHERVVQMLRPNDVLYDVFAGVGPFSVPAAKKKCHVLANDLNPESFKWLNVNAKRNKCTEHIKTFNKDGRDFITKDLKEDLLSRWKSDEKQTYKIHITMNLPAMATEFLDAFRGLFSRAAFENKSSSLNYPLVHVYAFAKGEKTKDLVKEQTEKHLGLPINDNLVGIHFVRNVAPLKDMYRVSFHLTDEILFDEVSRTSRKRQCEDSCETENNCKIKI